MATKLSDGIRIYACSMGKIFRVTHVLQSMEEANRVMENDRTTAMIAEDNNGLIYLAKQYGSIAPSELLKDADRD